MKYYRWLSMHLLERLRDLVTTSVLKEYYKEGIYENLNW